MTITVGFYFIIFLSSSVSSYKLFGAMLFQEKFVEDSSP